MNSPFKFNFYYLCCCVLFTSFIPKPLVNSLDSTKIVCGTATLTGKITVPENMKNDSIWINLAITYPISGETVQQKVYVDHNGQYALEVNMEISSAYTGISTSLNPYQLLYIKLNNNKLNHLDLTYDGSDKLKKMDLYPKMNSQDVLKRFNKFDEMIDYRGSAAEERVKRVFYDKSPDEYLTYAKTILNERLSFLDEDSTLSIKVKTKMNKDLTLFLYDAHVLNYKDEMLFNYRNTGGDKNLTPELQQVDRSYFSFLKDFKLNDPIYLNCFQFAEFQKALLQNESLNIPKIEDTDIPTWLKQVKGFMANLVGFSEGQYYDILAANAYARQMNEEVRPLSEKQIQNIQSYWKEGAISKILLRKNQEIAAIAQLKTPAVINDVSSIAPDKVIESILAKYPNKVVFIDLWATWCGPCLQAMTEFRPTKNEFHGKDVVFVYLSNPSSPRKLWEEKIIGIGSEQYYLNDEQWEHVMQQFDFEYIPSYLIFDQKGAFKHKHSAFPGNDKLKAEINSLL